ncbi:cytochrome c oxidase subunit 7A2, mitochondrial-like isoform X2 [Antedon mediterranea]|uniref:cytochrome c oxidase subunit 7A2, mitochondrial-like isoform X2 n=1 Tax=Antedon mediterranea TaxID=105859 RepID=UPI003AF80BCC
MNRILSARSLIPRARANLSTSSKCFDIAKVKRNQIRFQENNGKPIHLKGGPMDLTFTYLTMAFTFGSACYAFYGLSQLIMKK